MKFFPQLLKKAFCLVSLCNTYVFLIYKRTHIGVLISKEFHTINKRVKIRLAIISTFLSKYVWIYFMLEIRINIILTYSYFTLLIWNLYFRVWYSNSTDLSLYLTDLTLYFIAFFFEISEI